jgi:hypothetical protein
MNGDGKGRFIVPHELAVGLTLIGLLLAGAVLYSNAVRFQRYIEPMLAVLEPRIQYSSRFRELILDEFDQESLLKMKLIGNTLKIRKSFLMEQDIHEHGFRNYWHLGNLLQRLLDDQWIRSNTDFVLLSVDVPVGRSEDENRKLRAQAEEEAEFVMMAILSTSPDLRTKYTPYITSGAFSVTPGEGVGEWITVRALTSERLHTEMLGRLEKYAR